MSRWNWEWDFLALSKTSDELPLPTFLPVTRQKKNSLTRVDLKSPLQPSDFMILRSQTNIKWGRRKNHSYGRLPSQYGWWLMHPLYHVPQALLLFILIATLEGQCYDWTHFPDKALSEFNASEPKQDDSRISTAPAALHACSTDPPTTRKPLQEVSELKTIFTIIQNILTSAPPFLEYTVHGPSAYMAGDKILMWSAEGMCVGVPLCFKVVFQVWLLVW